MGNLIIKDNALIEASHKLNEVEQRLILLAILKARDFCNSVEQLKDHELVIHASDYIKTFNVDRNAGYKALKQAVIGLFEAKWGYKYVNERGNVAVRYERFTQSAEYVEQEGIVKFMFSNSIIPLLVELERNFTRYRIEQVSQLSSRYSMRLYEMFMQHFNENKGKGWLDISLDDLRFRLGLLPNEYKTMSNFKNFVLDFALKQINEHTDLSVCYEQKKQGRVIVGFRFDFKQKAKPANSQKNKKQKIVQEVDIFEDFSELERQAIQERIDEHIKRLEAKGELVSAFHRENITKKAVSERWGLDILAKKQEKEQEQREQRDRLKAQEQAEQDKKENERKILEQRKNEMIVKFENLSFEQQEHTLNEIAKKLGSGPFAPMFKTARAEGKAHTDPRFVNQFFDYFGI